MDKVNDTLKGWKADSLSQAGRLTLIKAVIQATPIHYLGSGNSALTTIKRIEKSRFSLVWLYSFYCLEKCYCPFKLGGFGYCW